MSPRPGLSEAARRERAFRVWCAIAVGSFFVLVMPAAIYSTDGHSMFALTASLVEHGDLTIPEGVLTAVPGEDGASYSKYGLGLPLAAAPFYALGWLISMFAGPKDLVTTIATLAVIPVTLGLLAAETIRLARTLGASLRSATLAGLGTVFGTFVLAYSQELFSEPLAALFLVIAVDRVLRQRYLTSGAATGLMVITRPHLVVVLPVLAALVLMRTGNANRLRFAIPVALALGAVAVRNMAQFGGPLESGYEGEGFTTPILEGLGGYLTSPEKSVILFAPVVLLALPALVDLVRRQPEPALLIATTIAAIVMTSATWHSWQGGVSWGPRLLLPAVPLALAVTAPWLDGARVRRALAVLLLAAGLAVSASTLLVPTTAQLVGPAITGDDGPKITRHYELVDDVVTDWDADRCDSPFRWIAARRNCTPAMWQVTVAQEVGLTGGMAAAVASLALMALTATAASYAHDHYTSVFHHRAPVPDPEPVAG